MSTAGLKRLGLPAGAFCLFALWLFPGPLHAASNADSHDPSQLLAYADFIKTADNGAFVAALAQLEKENSALSPQQRWELRYFKAWEVAYLGDLAKARPLLETIVETAPSQAVRMHATALLINILGYSHHYEEAYSRLDQALEQLPRTTDKNARYHLESEASQLLMGAGQYELAASYAEQVITDYPTGRNACIGLYLKSHADFLGGRMQGWKAEADKTINTCTQAGENLFTDGTRSDVANLAIRQGHIDDAINLLEKSYMNVVNHHYLEFTAEYNALLAQAYWKQGDTRRAEEFALKTVDLAQKSQFIEPLTSALQLLYQIERQKGNLREALKYHEKYTTADKGHLDDVREKALAYQIVRQQVEAKKVELNELNRQNQILQLQRALDHKAMITSRLYIALLLTIVASIIFWLYRLKRSQLRFMRMARRDGLTGICNRQHFMEEAEHTLRYVAKSARIACVILIDLDHFKNINDTYGHVVGDNALKRTVDICRGHLHSCDVFGRVGGEEFGILLPECTVIQAVERAEGIRLAVQAARMDDELTIELSASFGIACTVQYGYDLQRLLVAADNALYRAKREGRNRVVVSMDERAAQSPVGSDLASGGPFYAAPLQVRSTE